MDAVRGALGGGGGGALDDLRSSAAGVTFLDSMYDLMKSALSAI